ncbi:MAG: MFS transporter, partial [Anaerolineae bacterium]|nr:MFS transporter [Anaerolineae bacterium]
VGLIILMAVPLPFINVGFNTVFAELVPTQRRSEVVSWRNIILGGTITTVAFLAGRGLDALPFPQNYQLLYFIAFLGGLQSQYFFQKIQPPGGPAPTAAPAKPPRLSWAAARHLFQDNPGFLRITVNTFVYGIGPWMVTPLFSIYYVRELGASNGWVGALTAIINLTGILGYYLGRKIVKRWGERPVLAWSTMLAGLYPGLITLSPILDPILVMGGLYGIANSGLNLSHYSTLLRVIPEDKRPMGLAFYNLIMFSGAFVAPVVAVALADVVGVRTMLLVGAVFWVTGGVMHLLRPAEAAPKLQAVEPPPEAVGQQVEAKDGHEEGDGGDKR